MRPACPTGCIRNICGVCSSTTILPKGASSVDGKPIALTDIRAPIFAVGTVRDHVAPWRSTYKINLQTDTDVTYLLTTGGHNAGIVSEPGHDGRSFQVMTKKSDRSLRRSGNLLGGGTAQGWYLGGRNGLLGSQRIPVPQARHLKRARPLLVMPRSATPPELMYFNSDCRQTILITKPRDRCPGFFVPAAN